MFTSYELVSAAFKDEDTFPAAAFYANTVTPEQAIPRLAGKNHRQRAAELIEDRHGGRVPGDLVSLEALPGVGPYTARAIGAIAFRIPAGAVDTNVRRVLARLVTGADSWRTHGSEALGLRPLVTSDGPAGARGMSLDDRNPSSCLPGGSALGANALNLPFVFEPLVVVAAVLFSAAVGVGFGFFPARRAARLDPIEALRHE